MGQTPLEPGLVTHLSCCQPCFQAITAARPLRFSLPEREWAVRLGMLRRVKRRFLFAGACVLLRVDTATPPVGAESLGTLAATTQAVDSSARAAAGRMEHERQRYQRIVDEGGWPALPEGPRLKAGDSGSRVSILRHRLAVSGDLASSHSGAGDLFDDRVELAVRAFQRRHGLDEDGIVGLSTLAALNISAVERLRQID